ncbi:acylneuraminate cytidylyltransferase family protein [Ramlibacter sp. G-1-2-2]|uniref:Acylneuraminate cytidylyltransferase family protein n=1 Tax=Ramlibacter agri TaxID=2728837 RepID=A0A848H8P3_9BURK|nr:acylneuraminate cytidylyltransferase family protein [Ramlibacter agri]
MIAGRSVLALIPARGGSKRLPRKNLLPLGGVPLIGWSIRNALALPEVDQVLVSTDDAEIADTARELGADVPWLRPAELATDTASSNDAILHALDQCAAAGRPHDVLLLLQPTSPFRDPAQLAEALALCASLNGAPVVGFAPARSNPAWCFTRQADGKVRPVLDADGTRKRSQDLPEVLEISGNFYAIGVDVFRRERSFFTPETRALVSEQRELALDIDDAFDWLVAEAVAARRPAP